MWTLNFIILINFLIFGSLQIIKCDTSNEQKTNEVIHIPSEETIDVEETNNEEQRRLLVKNIKFVDTNTNTDDIFIPTKEWQVVKENQAIPKGLHIRLNMQTGLKEAKLLDDDPTGERMRELNENLFKEKLPMPSMKVDNEELKKALKNLKDKNSNVKFNVDDLQGGEQILSHDLSDEEKEGIKSKFRSYDELKKDFDNLNLSVKTDSEIMNELLRKYKNLEISKNEKLNLLQDFEYYVHQYDNGLLLCDIGAFKLIMDELNVTNNDIDVKINSALVIGGSMQGNPKVQVYAAENGLLQLLLNIMSKSDIEKSNNEFNSKIVFVLSTLLRHFPYAQLKFVELGGIQILNEFMQKSPLHKLKVKILTLVDDMISEKVDILNEKENSDPNFLLKLEQYQKINLKERLGDTDWCNYLTKLLSESTDHDTNEKILNSIKTLFDTCKNKLKNVKQFFKILDDLIKKYNSLENDEEFVDDNEYFKQIKNLAIGVREYLNSVRKKELLNEDL